MQKILSLAIGFIFIQSQANAQKLVSAELINTATGQILAFVNPAAQYDVNTYKITYNTTDIDGSATIASGALMVPVNSGCDQFGLVSYCHGTVLEKDNVPSENNSESLIPKLLASAGKITTAPDYLGLGVNIGLHPYVHAESEATAAIDLMRAAREFVNDSLSVSLNGEVFITGYSQGGHAAMATAKYIQDNNLLSEFDIKAVAPASGPYNMSGSQAAVLLSNQPYSNPGYVCYLLFAYNRVYGNIFNNYSDILKSPYDQTIPSYFNGNFPMDSVNNQLPSVLSDFLEDSVIANLNASASTLNHPIWKALVDNDNYDWLPTFPVEMYYCTQDEQVSFQNSIIAADSMNAKGAVSVVAVNNGATNHGGCVSPSISAANAFFNNEGTPCVNIGIDELLRKGIVSLYPNPAQGYFSVSGLEDEAELSIFDTQGRFIKKTRVEADSKIDISRLEKGSYIVRIYSKGSVGTSYLAVY